MKNQSEHKHCMMQTTWRFMEVRLLTVIIFLMLVFLLGGRFVPESRSCKALVRAFLPQSQFHIMERHLHTEENIRGKHISKDPNKREFETYGSAAYLFIKMGAYRGGPSTFAVVGLSSKPLQVFGNPSYECEWIPAFNTSMSVKGTAKKFLPDWGYGRVYTVVVINCTFEEVVGQGGGELVITASQGNYPMPSERIIALEESAEDFNQFSETPQYDYLYCGSSLYGDLSPQRMREWMAYHARFFGPRSHFVFHDAGGIHPAVRKVLEPWIEKGYVTVQDVRDQEAFDGYYHNQFLIVNDCLHRYKFASKWMFFFDVDEYLYVPPPRTLGTFMKEMEEFTQFTIEQYPVSSKFCLKNTSVDEYSRQWGFEKLVFKDIQRGVRRDRKYAIQARNVYSAGVHLSEHFDGQTTHKTEGKMRYYHYHNTINKRIEPCSVTVDPSTVRKITWDNKVPYLFDPTTKLLAKFVKEFERNTIGTQLESTPQ